MSEINTKIDKLLNIRLSIEEEEQTEEEANNLIYDEEDEDEDEELADYIEDEDEEEEDSDISVPDYTEDYNSEDEYPFERIPVPAGVADTLIEAMRHVYSNNTLSPISELDIHPSFIPPGKQVINALLNTPSETD